MHLSATSKQTGSLVTILTQIQQPVFLAYSEQDTFVGTRSIVPLVDERKRLLRRILSVQLRLERPKLGVAVAGEDKA